MREIEELLQLMSRLRDPESGCPWDREQTFTSILPYTIEEAYEVAEAIVRGDRAGLKDELGDLLFQVVFYAQMAREEGSFTFEEVARTIAEKLIRRHPHVFGEARYHSAAEQAVAWEQIKTSERGGAAGSVFNGVPAALPALIRAVKLQRKAAQVGFDWSEPGPIFAKIHEELEEIQAEIRDQGDQQRIMDEIGDLLFACVNLARHLGADPEAALRGTTSKFERRFRRIEGWLKESGMTPEQASLTEMDALWDRAKAEEDNQKSRKP